MRPTILTFLNEEKRLQLERFTVEALKKRSYTESDLITELCQRGGWNWETAQVFILSVKEKYRKELTAYQSRYFLIFYALLALIGMIIFLAVLERGPEPGKINDCLQISFSKPWQQFMGSDNFTQCYDIASADWFETLVRGGYESALIIIGGIGLIIFLLSGFGFVVTAIRLRRSSRDLTDRVQDFS